MMNGCQISARGCAESIDKHAQDQQHADHGFRDVLLSEIFILGPCVIRCCDDLQRIDAEYLGDHDAVVISVWLRDSKALYEEFCTVANKFREDELNGTAGKVDETE